MCDVEQGQLEQERPEPSGGLTRRGVLGAVAASAAAVAAGPLLGRMPAAQAAPPARGGGGLSLVALGTSGGPPPLAARFGISTAMVVNGRTYVIDCGRGAVSQYMRAGLSMPSLSGIFLTHLHSDHTVDYFSFPLLSAGVVGPQGFQKPIVVYGPGPSRGTTPVTGGPSLGTAGLTMLQNEAFAASTGFFLDEHFGVDPLTMVHVNEVEPPASTGATAATPAPAMQPFPVMENDDFRLSAILVPHGAVFPAYAYRFDTDHGSVVFSGDTARTPNIPTLAHGADVLVHEAADFDVLPQLGYPEPVIEHIKAVHTDVKDLGQVADEAEVGTLVATHLSPADPAVVSDAKWRQLLRESARKAGFRGQMVLATDLLSLPVRQRR